ncbi:hypothetical protein F4818DRAFT_446152 [Hypoxylon cercidicola]|nr:hypothetical protein F4818DRAFT_446152 [Hypoxylon cercidicola]
MCHEQQMILHCFECQKEYYRGPRRTPCPDVKNGGPCPKLVDGGQVYTNGETCINCQDMRKAEEVCQQMVYRMKPLYFNLENKRAIYESYCNRRDMLKRDNKVAIKKAEEDVTAGKKVDISKELDPVMMPASPFIFMRHQPSQFTKKLEAREAIPPG